MEAIWRQERSEGSQVLRLETLERLEGVEHILDAHLATALGALTEDQRDVALAAFDRSRDAIRRQDRRVDPRSRRPDLAARGAARRGPHSPRPCAHPAASPGTSGPRPGSVPPLQDLPRRTRAGDQSRDRRTIGGAAGARAQRSGRPRPGSSVDGCVARRCSPGSPARWRLLAAVFVVYALHQRQHAIHDQHSAESAEGAASAQQLLGSNPQLATAVALRALQLHRGPAAEAALRAAVPLLQSVRTLFTSCTGRRGRVQPQWSDDRDRQLGRHDRTVGREDSPPGRVVWGRR